MKIQNITSQIARVVGISLGLLALSTVHALALEADKPKVKKGQIDRGEYTGDVHREIGENWHGYYAFVILGTGNLTEKFISPLEDETQSSNGSHVVAINTGFNQVTDKYFYGTEFEISSSFNEFAHGDIVTDEIGGASLRGRIGLIPIPIFHTYATAGFSVTHVQRRNVAKVTERQNLVAAQFGIGTEFLLSEYALFRTEYLYSQHFEGYLPEEISDDITTNSHTHQVRFGFGWKF